MANLGIVGTGWGARVQIPTFREAGLNVVAVAGHNAAKTRQLASDLGLRAHDDWRSLIAADDIDLVSVVTPPSEHREMASAALDAGKHVLCEKPTALDAREAEELLQAAKNHADRITLIDHELRFLPSWRQTRARIHDDIGDVRYVEVRYSSPARGDRSRGWNWWSDAKRGGGIWGAVGSHFVDAMRYFGMEIESASATLRTLVAQRPLESGALRDVTSDDFAVIHLGLRGGASASMQFSTVSTGPDEAASLTIYGERGAIRIVGEEVLLSQKNEPFTRMAGGPLESRPGNSAGGAYGSGTLHLGRALKSAIDDGDRSALAPGATFEDGLMQQRVLDAVRASSANGGCRVAV